MHGDDVDSPQTRPAATAAWIERLRPLTAAIASLVVIVALHDETGTSCAVGHPSGALLVAAATVTGLAIGVWTWRPGRTARAVAGGAAALFGVGALLFVVSLLTWVQGCAN